MKFLNRKIKNVEISDPIYSILENLIARVLSIESELILYGTPIEVEVSQRGGMYQIYVPEADKEAYGLPQTCADSSGEIEEVTRDWLLNAGYPYQVPLQIRLTKEKMS